MTPVERAIVALLATGAQRPALPVGQLATELVRLRRLQRWQRVTS